MALRVSYKNRTDGHIDYIKADEIYEAIEDIVGDKECPANGIPYSIEV